MAGRRRKCQRLMWLGEGSAPSGEGRNGVEVRAVSSGGGVHSFYRVREGAAAGAAAGGGSINASHFGIERKWGGGEGRRFSGGSWVVGAPATEEEGGCREGRDNSMG
jgi:hypothetical protein